MMITTTKKRADYVQRIRRHPRPIDPYLLPEGGIGGLGDMGTVGIPAVDAVIAQADKKLGQAVLMLKVTAAASTIAAVTGLILLARSR
jgi:hypothetical protein